MPRPFYRIHLNWCVLGSHLGQVRRRGQSRSAGVEDTSFETAQICRFLLWISAKKDLKTKFCCFVSFDRQRCRRHKKWKNHGKYSIQSLCMRREPQQSLNGPQLSRTFASWTRLSISPSLLILFLDDNTTIEIPQNASWRFKRSLKAKPVPTRTGYSRQFEVGNSTK